jgi:hypothetical protein
MSALWKYGRLHPLRLPDPLRDHFADDLMVRTGGEQQTLPPGLALRRRLNRIPTIIGRYAVAVSQLRVSGVWAGASRAEDARRRCRSASHGVVL